MNETTEKVVLNSQIAQRNETKLFINHPLLRDLYSLYSRHAFEFMLQQSMFAHEVVSISEAGACQKKGNIQDLDDDTMMGSGQSGPDELSKPLKQGLPIGQLTVLDSDEMKYTVTVTRVGRSSIEHGVNGHLEPTTSNNNPNTLVSLTCNCRFFVHYRLHCVHMFAVFNAYQLRSATCIKPHDRWTKRYNWENYSKVDF